MVPPLDDVDRIMTVMATAFPADYGEAWSRRQVSDQLLLSGSRHGLITPSGACQPTDDEPTAGFYLSRGLFDEEELLLFAIAPNWRRCGLGSALLTHFIQSAQKLGRKRLFLEMRHNNPAGFLYAAHGFRPVGLRPRYYRALNGERIDAITQELLID